MTTKTWTLRTVTSPMTRQTPKKRHPRLLLPQKMTKTQRREVVLKQRRVNWAKEKRKSEEIRVMGQALLYVVNDDLLSDKLSGKQTTRMSRAGSSPPQITDSSNDERQPSTYKTIEEALWCNILSFISIWVVEAERKATVCSCPASKWSLDTHEKTDWRQYKSFHEQNKKTTNGPRDDAELQPILP